MRQILFTFLSGLSLLLCVATLILLLRSCIVSEHIAHADPSGAAWVVRSSIGVIYLDHRSRWDYERGWSWGRRLNSRGGGARHEYQVPDRGFRFLGFGVFAGTAYSWPAYLYPGVPMPVNRTDPRWGRDQYVAISFPHWLAVLIFGILPFRWYRQLRRGQRNAATGRCGVCGYDLRATPDRCPECGTVPESKPAPAT